MSVYKVPQDVEADDKLLGPFNFRQFIYLIVVVACIGLCIFLWGIFPGLIIIPMPVIIFFSALALPLRKDQPMEAYLAALVSFYTKPNKRFWQPDGVEHLIQIYAPDYKEEHLTKDLSQSEASKRLSYLADIVDTKGWAIKNAVSGSSLQDEYANEASTTRDMFDNSRISNNVGVLLDQNDQRRKQQILQNINIARDLAKYTDSSSDEIQDQTYFVDPKNKYIGGENVKFEEVTINQSQPPQDISNQQFQYQTTQANNFGVHQPAQNWQQPIQPQPIFQPQPITSVDNPENIHLQYNPYPDSINQSVISPYTQNQQNWQQPIQRQPSPAPLSNFNQAPQQIQYPQAPTPVTNQDNLNTLDSLSEEIQKLRELNQTVTAPKKDPKTRISTNPEDNPFINKKLRSGSVNVTNEISAEMKRLVSEGKDLSVETLARQANKINEREKNEVDLNQEEEVVISLR